MKTNSTTGQESRVAVDPVCGMSVDPEDGLASEHGGRVYHFCSERCRGRFESEPDRYVGRNESGLDPRREGNEAGGTGHLAAEATMENLHLAAFLAWQQGVAAKERVPPLLIAREETEALGRWFEAHRPEVVLTTLQEAGAPGVPWAKLLLSDAGDAVAGVRPGYERLGAAAVNLLAEQLRHDEFGVPADAKIVQVEGRWCDGGACRTGCERAVFCRSGCLGAENEKIYPEADRGIVAGKRCPAPFLTPLRFPSPPSLRTNCAANFRRCCWRWCSGPGASR